MKKNFDSHTSHANITSSSFDENEMCDLKKSIDVLGSILSMYAFDHNKLECIFHKKQFLCHHAHISRHTHSHPTHYDNTYARVLL